MKLAYIRDNILIESSHGELEAKLTEKEIKEFREIEEKYFQMQNYIKDKCKDEDGHDFFYYAGTRYFGE